MAGPSTGAASGPAADRLDEKVAQFSDRRSAARRRLEDGGGSRHREVHYEDVAIGESAQAGRDGQIVLVAAADGQRGRREQHDAGGSDQIVDAAQHQATAKSLGVAERLAEQQLVGSGRDADRCRSR